MCNNFAQHGEVKGHLRSTAVNTWKPCKQLVLHSPYIILGDLNAHNVLWGSGHTDTRGRLIERILNTYNLCILNDNSPTYLHPGTGTLTNIDLSFCDPSLCLDFTSWWVHSDLYGTDHFPILTSTSTVINDQFPQIGDLTMQVGFLIDLCSTVMNDYILDNDDPITSLTNKIIDIAHSTIPFTYFQLKTTSLNLALIRTGKML